MVNSGRSASFCQTETCGDSAVDRSNWCSRSKRGVLTTAIERLYLPHNRRCRYDRSKCRSAGSGHSSSATRLDLSATAVLWQIRRPVRSKKPERLLPASDHLRRNWMANSVGEKGLSSLQQLR